MSPIVPILAVLGAAGGAAAGVWYWLKKRKGRDEMDVIVQPEPTPPGPAPEPEPGPPKSKTWCSKAGKNYDVDRWSSPVAVAAALIAMGYPVGPTLVSASDVEQIKAFQRKLRELKIGPYANAPSSWIHGRIGPCVLVSMSEVEAKGIYPRGEDGE